LYLLRPIINESRHVLFLTRVALINIYFMKKVDSYILCVLVFV